jgi:hypothetical protein
MQEMHAWTSRLREEAEPARDTPGADRTIGQDIDVLPCQGLRTRLREDQWTAGNVVAVGCRSSAGDAAGDGVDRRQRIMASDIAGRRS